MICSKCGKDNDIYGYFVCECGATYWIPTPPMSSTPEYPSCPHRSNNVCGIASLIAGCDVPVDPIDCLGCQRHDSTHNDVTKQLATSHNPNLSSPERGVGTRLANTLSWFIKKPEGCQCGDRAETMNMWGPDGCTANMSTILHWLRESALDNGYPYSEFVVKSLLRSIIALSRKLDY